MNETAANATPRTSQSHGNGLNGGCSVPLEVRAATAKSPIEAEGEADPVSWRLVASLASVEKVRSATIQTGAETRGTSDRDGTGIGRAAMSRAVPRSSARRVRQMAHVSRCACTEARASGESARSRYAERSPNGCTA